MTESETFVVLANFFRDTYDEDQKGVSYWFNQNNKGDIKEFVRLLDGLIVLKSKQPDM